MKMTIDQLLEQSSGKGASDLHLLPGLAPITRIDGMLAPMKGASVLTEADSKELLYQLMTNEQREVFENNLVVEFAYSNAFGNYRVSVYHQLHGDAGVMCGDGRVVLSEEESCCSRSW